MSGPVPFIATAGVGEAMATVPGPLDYRLQRYNGSALRGATTQEIADYDAAQLDERAVRAFDVDKAIKAAILTSLRGRLGRNPTQAEINAERAVFIAVYKTLQ